METKYVNDFTISTDDTELTSAEASHNAMTIKYLTFAKPDEIVTLDKCDFMKGAYTGNNSMKYCSNASLRRHGTVWIIDSNSLKLGDDLKHMTAKGYYVSEKTIGADLLRIMTENESLFCDATTLFTGDQWGYRPSRCVQTILARYFPDLNTTLSKLKCLKKAFTFRSEPATTAAYPFDSQSGDLRTTIHLDDCGVSIISNNDSSDISADRINIAVNCDSKTKSLRYVLTYGDGTTYMSSANDEYHSYGLVALKDKTTLLSLTQLSTFLINMLAINGVFKNDRFTYRKKHDLLLSAATIFEKLAGKSPAPIFSDFECDADLYNLIWLFTASLTNQELNDFYDSLDTKVLQAFNDKVRHDELDDRSRHTHITDDPVAIYLGLSGSNDARDTEFGGSCNYALTKLEALDAIVGTNGDYDRALIIEKSLGANNQVSALLAASAGRLSEYLKSHFMVNADGHAGDLRIIDYVSRVRFLENEDLDNKIQRSCTDAILDQFGNDRLNGFVTVVYYGLSNSLTEAERMEFASLAGLKFDFLSGSYMQRSIGSLAKDRRNSCSSSSSAVNIQPSFKGMPLANLILCSLMDRSKAIVSGDCRDYTTLTKIKETKEEANNRVGVEFVSLVKRVCAMLSLKGGTDGSGIDPKKVSCCASVALHQVGSSKVNIDIAFEASKAIFDEVLTWKIKRTLFYGVEFGIADGRYDDMQYDTAKRLLSQQSRDLFGDAASECKLPNFMECDMQQLTSRLLDYYPEDSRSLGHELRAQLVADSVN